MAEPFGFLNIDKPLGLTSHDVVGRVRRGLKVKKVGHAGTLDPLATGVLVVCLGPATRLSEYAMAHTKTYRARVRLGVVTTTYDAEGDITAEHDPADITQPAIKALLPTFTGDILQMPPLYSAIKKGGRKLYEIARQGETVEIEPRAVRIDSLEISSWEPPHFDLEITCGSGTYIRSLAHDIGQGLGVGAHLARLVRTSSGVFHVGDAVSLETVLEDGWEPHLLPPITALDGWPVVSLDAEEADAVAHGRTIEAEDVADGMLARAHQRDGTLLAILRAERGGWRPHKVFSST